MCVKNRLFQDKTASAGEQPIIGRYGNPMALNSEQNLIALLRSPRLLFTPQCFVEGFMVNGGSIEDSGFTQSCQIVPASVTLTDVSFLIFSWVNIALRYLATTRVARDFYRNWRRRTPSIFSDFPLVFLPSCRRDGSTSIEKGSSN